jgi:pSer/pThr/pTyr-binding forkhead associated (FHA) protein
LSFLIQRPLGNGFALSEIPGDELTIGRGTSAELRSDNPAVALEHAVITRDETGYTITDKGSITGTYVNGRPVESQHLEKSDVIDVGDLRLEVQLANPAKPLFLRATLTRTSQQVRVAPEDVAEEEGVIEKGGAVRAATIDYRGAYRLARPYLTKLTITAIVLVVALAIVGEVIQPGKQTVFAPGGISSAHSRAVMANGEPIANDCHACHDPWRGVTDARCETCHGAMIHAENQAHPPACMSCHAEHRGATRLASSLTTAKQCGACHANIAAHRKQPMQTANVTAFGVDHPELTPPPDRSTLRFNHKFHLNERGIFNGEGKRQVLECESCHKLVSTRGKIDPAPLKFGEACQSCHRLTFDQRFPNAEVPHGGDPGMVTGFILATYAGNQDILGKPPEEIRRLLSRRATAAPDQRAVLAAEQVIKTRCAQCHELRRAAGHLTAVKPLRLARWLNAKFTHGSHKSVGCEGCHAAAKGSSLTSDTLMPVRKDCTACHGERATVAASLSRSSGCVVCHDYHAGASTKVTKVALASLRGSGGAGRMDVGGRLGMLGSILLVFIGLLLLVVFVPAGIALFQRLRPVRRPEVAARPAAPPPATVKIPPLSAEAARGHAAAPPAAAPPPAAPRAPAMEETRMVDIAAMNRGNAPQATEMVQWNGMLLCSSGPLEGQRFIIEDDGLYIGRDSTLSKIVINDSRVSKRHLRIVPRDGKVWAIDQGSTNGTFLGADKKRITEVQLKRGDTLILGDGAASFTYQI